MAVRVKAKQEGRVGPEERLVVICPVGESRVDYFLTNAGPEVPLAEIVRAQRRRHRIEEMFEAGNGEAGLDHYEVRSWVGWHHHMTLSLVALWFLCLERRHLGGENPGGHRAADPLDRGPAAPRSAPEPGRDRPRGVAGAAA
jgi:SRSO17 transposase